MFKKYDPNFLAASLDEAYLDITSVGNERSMTAGDVCQNMDYDPQISSDSLHCHFSLF